MNLVTTDVHKWVVLAVFSLVYLYFVFFRYRRVEAIWVGILVLLGTRVMEPQEAAHWVNWNVIGIFAGTLVVTELFIYSKVPVLLSDLLVDRARTVGMAILGVSIFSSFISVVVENVATVLIVAPIALEIARRLKVSPAPFLISIAICSNLQGTATLVGDPPSMILAGYERMSFNDFFVYRGKPGIFFAVQLGAVTSFAVLYLLFRRYRQPTITIPIEEVLSWFPTGLLAGMIAGLAISPWFDPDFRFLGGLICVAFGGIGLVWIFRRERRTGWTMLRRYDWRTTLLLAGVFILVGALDHVGLIQDLARRIGLIMGDRVFLTYTFIVWFSVLFSAFIDNVPYVTAMIPVTHVLASDLGASRYLFVFGLLVGACLGGNITPIGASANIVSVGLLRRSGYPVSFLSFVKIGLPFTIAATLAGYLFIWWVWG